MVDQMDGSNVCRSIKTNWNNIFLVSTLAKDIEIFYDVDFRQKHPRPSERFKWIDSIWFFLEIPATVRYLN